MNTVDARIYFICEKCHLSYIFARTSFEVIFFLFGILLGGVVGIGTVILACLTGVITNILYKKIKYLKEYSKRYRSILLEKELV